MSFVSKYAILTPRLRAAFERWADDRRGVAALEFAMISIPFFFLVFGLIEISMIFIFSTILEHGAGEAARLIRTGQIQSGQVTEQDFKLLLCGELFGLIDCDDRLQIDVRTFNSFSTTSNNSPIGNDGEVDDTEFQFTPGNANDIVVVRAFYEWQLFTPVLSAPLANLSGGRRLLQATASFRNEPF